MIWTYIKADRFFPKYAPEVKNYKQKISGKNTRGNPLDFSETDKAAIRKGLKQLFKDLQNDHHKNSTMKNKVTISPMSQSVSGKEKTEVFATEEKARGYFLDWCAEHDYKAELEDNEAGGVGHDYRITLHE